MDSPPELPPTRGFGPWCLRTAAHALFAARGYWGPQRSSPCSSGLASDLSGSSIVLSARALPYHPGWFHGCTRFLLPRRLQTSPSLAGWSPPLCVTRPNRVRFRWAHAFAVQGVPPSRTPVAYHGHQAALRPGLPPVRKPAASCRRSNWHVCLLSGRENGQAYLFLSHQKRAQRREQP